MEDSLLTLGFNLGKASAKMVLKQLHRATGPEILEALRWVME
jgi:hypothetical protein